MSIQPSQRRLRAQARSAIATLSRVSRYFEDYVGNNAYAQSPWIGKEHYASEIRLLEDALALKGKACQEALLPPLKLAVAALRDAASKMNWLNSKADLERQADRLADLVGLPRVGTVSPADCPQSRAFVQHGASALGLIARPLEPAELAAVRWP